MTPWTLLTSLVTLVAAAPALAQPVTDTSGTITYHVEHRLKAFDAVLPADALEAQLVLDPASLDQLRFGVRIPLARFDSGNTLRDEHAAEALETYFFPVAVWRVDHVEVLSDEAGPPRVASLRVSGPLELHGASVTLTADMDLILDGGEATARSTFDLSLEAFGIARPGLLGMKIEDSVTVTVELTAGIHLPQATEVTP